MEKYKSCGTLSKTTKSVEKYRSCGTLSKTTQSVQQGVVWQCTEGQAGVVRDTKEQTIQFS